MAACNTAARLGGWLAGHSHISRYSQTNVLQCVRSTASAQWPVELPRNRGWKVLVYKKNTVNKILVNKTMHMLHSVLL